MATLETLKDPKEQHSCKDPREDWVSTADMVPSLGLEVLAIADGELTTAHLSDDSELGYHWYSWGAAKCLHNVTHWQFHPALPPEFEIRQREIHAECLNGAASHCLSDAERELEKVKALKETLNIPLPEDAEKTGTLLIELAKACVIAASQDEDDEDVKPTVDVYSRVRTVCVGLLGYAGLTEKMLMLITEIGVKSALAGIFQGRHDEKINRHMENGKLEEVEDGNLRWIGETVDTSIDALPDPTLAPEQQLPAWRK